MPGCLVSVDDAVRDGPVKNGYSNAVGAGSCLGITRFDGGHCFLDSRSHGGALAGIVPSAHFGLAGAFPCLS